jgi:hypothetical protein
VEIKKRRRPKERCNKNDTKRTADGEMSIWTKRKKEMD